MTAQDKVVEYINKLFPEIVIDNQNDKTIRELMQILNFEEAIDLIKEMAKDLSND
jgi:hypothetical protein